MQSNPSGAAGGRPNGNPPPQEMHGRALNESYWTDQNHPNTTQSSNSQQSVPSTQSNQEATSLYHGSLNPSLHPYQAMNSHSSSTNVSQYQMTPHDSTPSEYTSSPATTHSYPLPIQSSPSTTSSNGSTTQENVGDHGRRRLPGENRYGSRHGHGSSLSNDDRLAAVQEHVTWINENLAHLRRSNYADHIDFYDRFASIEEMINQVSTNLATQMSMSNVPPRVNSPTDLSITSALSSTSGASSIRIPPQPATQGNPLPQQLKPVFNRPSPVQQTIQQGAFAPGSKNDVPRHDFSSTPSNRQSQPSYSEDQDGNMEIEPQLQQLV